MKKVRKISREYYLRQIVACWLVSCMLFAIPAQVAMADISPGVDVVPGPGNLDSAVGAGITESLPNWLEVTQTAQEAIMNWNNFDIGANSAVQFLQPEVTAAVLNRVSDAAGTGIMGSLTANGRVFIVNPAGIVFGGGATINVAQLVASSLKISDLDFTNGIYNFTDGLNAGDVTNEGTINADRIALIGKQVINKGALVSVAEDGYVIMAAGETVTISENSPVSVAVTLPDGVLPGDYEYKVEHDGSLEADHVILAAGDIWSTAISGVETLRAEAKGNVVLAGDILAEAGAASDAVADITIITGGDFTVEDYKIEAVAVGDGVGGFDATAGVTIDAAGDVEVLGGVVRAEASDGVDNQANVNITGKNVTAEVEIFDMAAVKAYAHDGDNNTAGVTIIADGLEVDGDGNVMVGATGLLDLALISAMAEDGTTNTATVNITANDEVMLEATGLLGAAMIEAKAVDGTTNTAGVNITAEGDVMVEATGFLEWAVIEAKAENLELELPDDEDALTLEGLVNTATVTINATEGDVLVTSSGNSAIKALAQNEIEINYDEYDAENSFTVKDLENTAAVNLTGANVEIVGVSGDATVEAIAKNEIDVDISHYEGDVTVNLEIVDLENNATVTLNATDGDVLVQGGETVDVGTPQEPDLETTLGDALVAAEAYNVVDIKQHTGGRYKVKDGPGWRDWHWEYLEDYAATLNLTTNDLTNDALVDIDATDNIKVIADGSKRRSGSDAIVRAEAYNELVGSGCDVKDVTVNLAAGLTLTDDNLVSLSNKAEVQMTATNNNVEVTALRGGFASVKADAYNIVEGVEGVIAAACCGGGGDIVVFVAADNIANDALVDVDAGDDVLVTAECDEKDSKAEVLAYAWNDIPGEPTNDAVNITNNAQIEIDATNVDVKSTNGGEARIFANAYDGTDNTAGVTINADGNVEVMHNDDAEAYIEAIATSPWGNNNTATVLIDAYANLLIDNGYVGAWAEGGVAEATVTVDTASVHVNNEGEIIAEAQTYFDDVGDALATVDVTTTGIDGVVVENGSQILSDAFALDSGNTTAKTTVKADDVTVDHESQIYANAESFYGSGDAIATTDITTTSSEVIVDHGSQIWSYAYTDDSADDSGDTTAKTTVIADDVTVDNDSEIWSYADTHYGSGDAKATTDITTTSSEVDVDNDSKIYSYAYTYNSGDATADTNILAGSVNILSSEVKAEAANYTGLEVDSDMLDPEDVDDNDDDVIGLTVSGAATATVDITATKGSVQIRGGNGVVAKARNDVNVDIEGNTFKDNLTVNLTVEDLTADADVTIKANEDVDITDAKVNAQAENKFKAEGSGFEGEEEPDIALNLTVNNLESNADAVITATNGEVEIEGSGDAEVKANAITKLDDMTKYIDVTETVDNIANNATVNITADDDVTVNDGDVEAVAGTEDGGVGDATAGVTVTAANVTVQNNSGIGADAYANDLGDATSTVVVTTTSSEVIVENSSEIWSYAYTNDSGDATATTTVIAGDVTVDEESEISADAETHDGSGDALATVDVTTTSSEVLVEDWSSISTYAYADSSGDATAKTTVTADDVTVDNESEIRAEAEASNSGDATADVDILAESVEILSSEVLAKAKKTTTLTVDYEMLDPDNVDDDVADVIDLTVSGAATATVDITATDGDVDIKSNSRAKVMADAKNKVEINIDGDNFDDDVTVNLTAEDLTADADVKITANEDVDIKVEDGDDAIVKAEAENKFEVMASEGEEPEDPDVTLNLTVNPLAENTLAANANVDITATNGNVEIDGGSEARVEAIANTKLLDEIDEGIVVTETVDNVASNATVDIIADGDVTLDDGIVKAKAEAKGGEGDATADVTVNAANLTVTDDSEIKADAEAKEGADDAEATVTVNTANLTVSDDSEIKADAKAKHGSGDAEATITVDAANVTVVDDSKIKAEAKAKYGSGDATATTDITLTGSEVLVEDDSGIYAEADTGHGSGDAEATVTVVDADNVTVRDDSDIEADAYAEYCSGDATALVDIDADGNVLVEDDSWIWAWAETYYYGSGNATATVDILAGGNVTVSGREVPIEEAGGDDTSVIGAHAMTYQPKCEESSGSATADVDIDAGGYVLATRNGKIAAVALALSGDGGQATALQEPYPDLDPVITLLPRDATATVDIIADGDVTVEKGSEVVAVAKIENVGTSDLASLDNGDDEIVVIVPGDATATVDILAGRNVTVSMGGEVYAEAGINNYAEYPIPDPKMDSLNDGEDGPPPLGDADATVDILAGGKVTVDMGGEVGAYARIDNYVSFHENMVIDYPILPDLGDATANVYIDAFGDVTVSKGGEVYADAELLNSGGGNSFAVGSLNGGLELPGLGDATANIEITTPGSLTVDKGGEVYAEASIEYGELQAPSIGGLLLLDGEVDEDSGDATASVNIKAREGVTVGERSEIAADAWIDSYAFGVISDLGPIPGSAPQGDAFASVDILTCGDVIVDGLIGAYADINTQLIKGGEIDSSPNGPKVYSGDTSANVEIRAYGDVIVNSEEEEEELGGDFVESQNPSFGGRIEAIASDGYENFADITILAVGDVIVNDGSGPFCPGEIDSSGPFVELYSPEEILANAYGGYTNDAFVGIATRGGGLNPDSSPGDVIVSGQIGARTSQAYGEGSTNTSNVEISAARDVIVNGGYAQYGSVRGTEGRERDAVQLEAEEGGQIMAGADDGYLNTANVNIFAGRDVTVHGAEVEYVGPVLPGDYGDYYYDGGQILATAIFGGVNTANIGIYAKDDVTINDATITGEPFNIDFPDTEPFDVDLPGGEVSASAGMSMKSSAEVVICALDNVIVDGDIEAIAVSGKENSALIEISAGTKIAGTGYIEAYADDGLVPAVASIVFKTPTVSFTGEAYPEPVQEAFEGCPDCDFDWIDWLWCKDCEEEELIKGVAPIGAFAIPGLQPVLFQEGGCTALMVWLSNELGVGVDIQVFVANAFAYSTDCQPCEIAARLKNAATILADEDGSHMAAMNQIFSVLAPDAPFTPAMAASIVTAFAGRANDGTQYAVTIEYIDAFVQYVAIVNNEMGSPVIDPVAFVMNKYGTGLTENQNAFIATRLQAGETFAQ